MKNGDKYKTTEERYMAFKSFCHKQQTNDCYEDRSCLKCTFLWLDTEAEDEEKPLPCLFCGGTVKIEEASTKLVPDGYYLVCHNDACLYRSAIRKTPAEAIAIHNQVAKVSMDAKEIDAKQD